jgi:hypothetical protein
MSNVTHILLGIGRQAAKTGIKEGKAHTTLLGPMPSINPLFFFFVCLLFLLPEVIEPRGKQICNEAQLKELMVREFREYQATPPAIN